MEDLQHAMGLDNLEVMSFPSQPYIDGVEHVNTQYVSITQLNNEFHGSPIRFVRNHTPFFLYEFMYMMHSENPCTPTPLHQILRS